MFLHSLIDKPRKPTKPSFLLALRDALRLVNQLITFLLLLYAHFVFTKKIIFFFEFMNSI
jgi:hypothetical protein